MATDPQADTPADGDTSADDGSSEHDIQGSNYEIIRERLIDQAADLRERADALNDKRREVFGGTELGVVGQETIRTENNCIPQDIVNIGGRLLFGYNVYIGMKSKTSVDDVFSLHRFHNDEEGFELESLPEESDDHFLTESSFLEDFNNLYAYYDDVRLRQFRKLETRLLAVFQLGESLDNIQVLRWGLDAAENVDYLDNAGKRDFEPPEPHDFAWHSTGRDDHVRGKHPHVSIEDDVFVETVDGDLTIKVEDNTEDGKGIYSEPVDDQHQSLGDADIAYHRVGNLILIKMLPYREEEWRYFVFNTLTEQVERIDAIGDACVTLPEEHGVIFPGGYALSDGQSKRFDVETEGMRFQEKIKSANGEDVLFVFYRPQDGHYLLFSYNVIRKEVENPIDCHGYSLFRDGTMIVFEFTSDEATRVHPMQIWETPYHSDEYAAEQPTDDSFLANLGNSELVHAISDTYSVCRMIDDLEPTVAIYEALIKEAQTLKDNYFWLDDEEAENIGGVVGEVVETAQLVIDEFQKVQALKEKAAQKLEEAEARQSDILSDVHFTDWNDIDRFVEGLDALQQQRGRLITLRDVRYIDEERLDALEEEVVTRYDELSEATVDFLLGDQALAPYRERLESVAEQIPELESTVDAEDLQAKLEEINEGLNLLTDLINDLDIEDPSRRTQILEDIGEVMSTQNQTSAKLDNKMEQLREQEGQAEFAVQFQLFDQTVNSALGMADTPEACDEQLTRLLTQLEELESQFSEFDEYLQKLAEKRDEVYEIFESRKQSLIEEKQRQAQNIVQAAERVIESIERRASNMDSVEDLNAFFASDSMVMKVRDHIERLREMGEDVKADDIQTQLTAAQDQSVRELRDKTDLYSGDGDVIELGRHKFSVSDQEIELTMVPRDGQMRVHITGTDFFEPIDDPEFAETREFWDQTLVSETDEVYRAEYLAATILFDASDNEREESVRDLHETTLEDEGLQPLIREEMDQRYDEGYERGVHDEDAAKILSSLLGLYTTAGLLRFTPEARAIACLFWAFDERSEARQTWSRRSVSLGRLRSTFDHGDPMEALGEELGEAIYEFADARDLRVPPEGDEDHDHVGRFTEGTCMEAGRYLAEELVDETPTFIAGSDAVELRNQFLKALDSQGDRMAFEEDVDAIGDDLGDGYELVRAWLVGYCDRELDGDASYILPETVSLLLADDALDREETAADTETTVHDLLGQHPRIDGGDLELRLDEFLTRLRHYVDEHVPAWRRYKELSREILERQRHRLGVSDLETSVLSTFVRNELIDQVYLPLVGDNLAKQMGTAGEDTRSDRSGMLFLISPPGYGKTVLMEYIADRLGVMFVKVNGPALGHDVTSLDPSEAPNATAREEVEKLNLALEMGNNVMLYVDDVQHVHPEFLQKFISLCDSTRQIEGVWNGETKTYDLRGKRFCVIMAGNPYTESGERFQIPDMLANRADTYNLGDILSGSREAFERSYIENSLTSNDATAPLVGRDSEDVDRFIRMAEGEQIPLTEMSYDYSQVEAEEIVSTLEKLMQIRDVVLKVNQQYIESAGKKDEYRSEPPFQLQGSYRNMIKMAEKVAPAMNEDEVEQIIDNHYQNEAQTLTTGAEQNLLKLAELRGTMTDEEKERWKEVKREFERRRMMGGDDDPVSKVAGPLATLVQRVEDVQGALSQDQLADQLEGIRGALGEVVSTVESVDTTGLAAAGGDTLEEETEVNVPGAPVPSSESPESTEGTGGTNGPAVEILEEAVDTLEQAELQVRVEGDVPAKVEEMLDTQLGLIESAIVPLAKAMHEHLDEREAVEGKLDEVLGRLQSVRAGE
jgi:hypothetical protein